MTPSTPNFGSAAPAYPPLNPPPPKVPDHKLIRVIGRGAYGEVWLGRNLMGTWRAIKVVRRTDFDSDRPLQRELKGIHAYEPISRTHEGLVDILQLGANEADGCFYYVMELADAVESPKSEVRSTKEARSPNGEPTGAPDAPGTRDAIGPNPARQTSKEPEMLEAEAPPTTPDAPPPAFDQRSSDFLRTSNFELRTSTRPFDPNAYEPHTLSAELKRRGRLPFAECLRIALSLADALRHLHAHGLVHRDIKPSNIIFVNGIPKLADIGLVAETGEARSIAGTEGFIAPEGPGSAQADLYSLGKTLYELSTGLDRLRFPEPRTDLGEDPEREDWLELNAIILKACEPASRRYRTAAELHAELVLLQGGKSVRRLRATERRLKMTARSLAIAIPIMLLTAAGWFWQQNQARRFRELSDQNAALAQQEREQRVRATGLSDTVEYEQAMLLLDQGKTPEALAHLARLLRRNPTNRLATAATLNHLLLSGFDRPLLRWDGVISAAISPDGERVFTTAGSPEPGDWYTMTVWVWHKDRRQTLEAPRHFEHRVYEETRGWVWNTENGELVVPPITWEQWDSDSAFSLDGRWMVSWGGNKAQVWDVQSIQPVGQALEHAEGIGGIKSAAFTPDGRWVVTASWSDHQARVWETKTGTPVGQPMKHEGGLYSAEFSPDGRWVVTASSDGTSRIWDAQSGSPAAPALRHGSRVMSATFSPDGRWVVTASYDGTARVWGAQRGEPVCPPMWIGRSPEMAASFSPDGRSVVSVANKEARLWDAQTGRPMGRPMQHEGAIYSVRFSPDGRRVLTASTDKTARYWDAWTAQPVRQPFRHDAEVLSAVFSRHGRWVMTEAMPVAYVWDTHGGKAFGGALPRVGRTTHMHFLRASRLVESASPEENARLWQERAGAEGSAAIRRTQASPRRGTFSPDGRWCLSRESDNMRRLWDLRLLEPVGRPWGRAEFRNQTVELTALSPDGRLLLVVNDDGTGGVFRSLEGERICALSQNLRNVNCAAFSADGLRVVTAYKDGDVCVWDARNGRSLVGPVRHHGDEVLGCTFSPDGRQVVTASVDQTARVWEARSGQPIGRPLLHDGNVLRAAFSSDGRWVVTTSLNGVRVWDAETGLPVCQPLRESFLSASFSQDGRLIVTMSENGVLRGWPIGVTADPAPDGLALLAEAAGGLSLSDNGDYTKVSYDAWTQLATLSSTHAPATGAEVCIRWLLADRSTRTISPWSTESVAEYVEDCIESDNLELLNDAADLSPTNGLVYARLALATLADAGTNQTTRARAEFFSRYALKLATNSPAVWTARAQVLLGLGETVKVRDAVERAEALGADGLEFWQVKSHVREADGQWEPALQGYDKVVTLAEAARGRQTAVRKEALLAQVRILERLHRKDEAVAVLRRLPALAGIPTREASMPARLIDLSRYYNASLDDDWHDPNPPEMSLKELPKGLQTLGGTDFDVRGIVQLSGQGVQALNPIYPEQVTGIEVNRRCAALEFLHATGWTEEQGTPIGNYVMHYADGQTSEFPVLYGETVVDWNIGFDPEGEARASTKVWEDVVGERFSCRLFKTTWKNPRPEVELRTIDFVSKLTRSCPFLIAITAE